MKQFLPDLAPLRRSRDFRLLYCGQTVSGFGSALTYVTLPIQMYALTKSSVMVGLLGVVEFVPMLLVAFIGGVLADRFNRRVLVLLTDSLMALVLVLLTWNALQTSPQVWVLFCAAALMAGFNAIQRPAMEAMTPQLILPEEMAATGALNMMRHNAAYIAGPGLAGWIAVRFGAGAAFGLDAVTYLVAVGAMLMMRQRRFEGGELDRMSWHTLVAGWRYALERRDLLGTYLIDMNAMFFGMPNALFPAFGERLGPENVGWLYAAGPVGALVVSLISGWTGRIRRHGIAIAWAAGLWGLAIVGFGLSPSLVLALGFLVLAGAADGVSGIFRMTIWNQTIPASLRGRTAAIEMVSYLSGPYLGNVEAGFAARLMGLGPSVVLGGMLCTLGSVAITWALPEFRKYRAKDFVRSSQE